MKKSEIKVGGLYTAKVNNALVTVRVDAIRERMARRGASYHAVLLYDVTNLKTGRKTTFRSAAKFRVEVPKADPTQSVRPVEESPASIESTEDDARADFDRRVDEALETAPGSVMEDEQSADPTDGAGGHVDTVTTTSAPTACVDAGATTSSFAARIAQAQQGRSGSLVAGMVPNAEQEAIIATAQALQEAMRGQGNHVELKCVNGIWVLIVVAGAGAGKTATCKMMEQVLQGRGQYTAFNKSLVEDSRSKFTKARVSTTHALAFGAEGKKYQHRLPRKGVFRMKSWQIAQMLGIEGMTLELGDKPVAPNSQEWNDEAYKAGFTHENPPPEGWMPKALRHLKPEFLAGQVMVAIGRFTQSADPEIGSKHVGYIDGIDALKDGKRSYENNDRVKEYLTPFLKRAWEDIKDVEGRLPFSHDCYVKLWQLGQGDDRPVIAADYILLDEYQDTAPVFLDVLMQQKHSLLVLVGDDNQRIYEWRGAVNAGDYFPGAPRRLLSQSYRFGQIIADVANTVLGELDEPTDLVMKGNPTIPSRVVGVDSPKCYLFRTNASCIGRLMACRTEGKRVCLIGKCDDIISWCRAALDLQAIPPRATDHPELGCFESWNECVEYSTTDEGADLRLMVKLVKEFGAQDIIDALQDQPSEEDADVVVSTAHKSKGREWDTVKLGQDFPLANKMGDADRRLLYVAATRAKLTLDISDCPPFCGGTDEVTREFVPGLRINYTVEMPTEEDQAEWLLRKITNSAIPAVAPGRPATASGDMGRGRAASACPDATVGRPGTGNGIPGISGPVCQTAGLTSVDRVETVGPAPGQVEFTWTKDGDKWAVRGPANLPLPIQATVVRRDGSSSVVTLRSVVKKWSDAWVYGI